jgi:hypothetical protein
MSVIDLTGLRYGKLTVVEFAGQDNYSHAKWRCRCDCGGETVSLSSNLRNGCANSCGCINKYEDLTGNKYSRLVVIGLDHKNSGKYFWRCRCDCGSQSIVSGCDLKGGHTRSCGCLALEIKRADKKFEDFAGRKIGRLFVLGVSKRIGSKRYWKCQCDCGKIVEVLSGGLRAGTSSCGCLTREIIRKKMSEMQKRKKDSGIHGNRWKAEMSMEDRLLNRNRDYLPEMVKWRKEVYRRDGWCCQVCGSKNHHGIIAHHIDSWADNKASRFAVDNGVVVCKRCHKKFHSRYGWGENTLGQWSEFLTIRSQIGIAV